AVEPIMPLRLFRSSVFSVCGVLAFIVGFAMLGSMTFLPTYLQYVHGSSATSSGLQTLPLVVGLLGMGILSGTVVGRTGRYKVFPVVGSAVMAVGLYLLSRLGTDTPYWQMALAMLVLGIGIGSSMQVLTIVVQSTVAYDDLGVATSGVTFFRTLGSSFGAAVFGTVFANVLNNRLPAAVAASPGVDPAAVSSPEALHSYPADQIAPIVAAYAHAVHVVFLTAVPVPLVALVLAVFLKEVPLRGTARGSASDLGEGFGMPEGDDAKQQLQLAIARLLQRKGRTHLPMVRERAGVRFGVADQWAVGQVYLRSRLGRPATVEEISVRYRLPAEVLTPAFQDAIRHGYLQGNGDGLELTELGREQMAKFVAAMRVWLAEELADWGADDAKLAEALGDLATRFIEQTGEPVPELARSAAVGA
ncbi:MAG TPA: MFS transporter, partial [Nocardioides sp.]|nr:MFS transporter [Nocardioides sp.]